MTAVLDEPLLERLRVQGDQPAPLLLDLGPDTRICEVCAAPYTRRSSQSRGEFAKRKACTFRCGHALRSRSGQVSTPPKTCAKCGGRFTRPPAMSTAKFAAQRHCSTTCAATNRPRKPAKVRDRPGPETRTCDQCGGEFTRKIGSENRARFQTRRTCSRQCGSLLRGAETPTAVGERPCAHCGEVFHRKPRGESPKQWARRKVCGTTCASAAKRAAPRKARPAETPAAKRPRRSPCPKRAPVPPAAPQPARPVWRPGSLPRDVQVFGTGHR